MTTYYVDFENGNDANSGTTFAQRKKSLASVLGVLTSGVSNEVRVMASADPVAIGNCTWTNKSKVVTLPAAVTQTIDNCESGWVAANANVTVSNSSVAGRFKEGSSSTQMVIATAFTTGKIAYKATGALNLSSYQQLCFWISPTAAMTTALTINLCSDTTGDVPVHSFTLPVLAGTTANTWYPFVFDNGSALSSNINSVSISCTVDPGTPTFNIDHIFAALAPSNPASLTLNTIIGKGYDNECYLPIKSISGTSVTLDGEVNSGPTLRNKGYFGTTETVVTYKVTPIDPFQTFNRAVNAAAITWTKNGVSLTDQLAITGGWNRTDMSTQTGETWTTGVYGGGIFFSVTAGVKFIFIDKMNGVRWGSSFCKVVSSVGVTIGTMRVSGCGNITANIVDATTAKNFRFTKIVLASNQGGILISGAAGGLCTVGANGVRGTNLYVYDSYYQNASSAQASVYIGGGKQMFDNIYIAGGDHTGLVMDSATVNNLTVKDCTYYAISAASTDCKVLSGSSSGNAVATYNMNSTSAAKIVFKDFTSTDATLHNITDGASDTVIFHNKNGVADNHITYTGHGTIAAHSGANRHTASGLSWEYILTGTNALTVDLGLAMVVARVAVKANQPVTATIWAMRTGTSTITGSLWVGGHQIAGVDTMVYQNTTASAGVWEQLSVTFTPTETSVVEISALAIGSASATNKLYFDDIAVTQG